MKNIIKALILMIICSASVEGADKSMRVDVGITTVDDVVAAFGPPTFINRNYRQDGKGKDLATYIWVGCSHKFVFDENGILVEKIPVENGRQK